MVRVRFVRHRMMLRLDSRWFRSPVVRQAVWLAVPSRVRVAATGFRNRSLHSAGVHRFRGLANPDRPGSRKSRFCPAHLPSVRVNLRYGGIARAFCALTRWNVLSYRHCCRGIATVTRSVARCPLPAWQLVASSFKLVAGASSTANSGPFWGNVWRFAPPRVVTFWRLVPLRVIEVPLAVGVETPFNKRPHGIRVLEACRV